MLAVDFRMKSQQEAEIRQRLITILDRDYKAGKTVSLQQLHQECENFLSLKRDSEVVAGTMKLVEATSVQKRKEIECWNCEGNHRASGCQAKTLVLQEVQEDCGRTEATQKTQHTKEKFSRNRNNRGPRKQVRIVKIANAAVQANSSRVYIDAVVNNYSVKFLLDTGSDITLLNEKIWKKMGSPALEKTNIVVKNASGDTMKIYGKLKCKITMKGVTTEGDAYVTPHNSLLGLEWIRANENLMYHIEMMAAEVKANCNPRREEEKVKGEEKPSEDTINVILQAYRTTPHRCLEDRTPAEMFLGRKLHTRLTLLLPTDEPSARTYAEENRRKMKEQYDRRSGVGEGRSSIRETTCVQMWKAPRFTWKQGVVAKRLGKVNYEVVVEGRLMRKHANQLRHSNTTASWRCEDKSLKTLLDVLELDDNRLRSSDEVASDLDVNTAIPCSPEPSLRRSKTCETIWH
ncbi:retroviral aspartyl protease [Cooperia oncophora]